MNTVLFAALDKMEGDDRDTVIRVFMASSPSTQDVENAMALVRGTGAGGIALNQAQRFADAALEALDEQLEGPVRDHLEGMLYEVLRRRS